MRLLRYFYMGKIKERWRGYRDWQEQSFSVAPMSDEEHRCVTCATEFRGNFCPRCGQSSKIQPRMSFWKTFLLFLDIWGIGNRSMFRTLRDLLLRPGFLIRDYIRGHRSAYFPPFKLLFILTTLSILVGHGWNLGNEIYNREGHFDDEFISQRAGGEKGIESFYYAFNDIIDFQNANPALFQLGFMLYSSFFFFWLFRKTKSLGKLNFHEFFISMVYMLDMLTIYNILMKFLGMSSDAILLANALYIIPLKQLSGYGWIKTSWRFVCSVVGAIIAFILLLFIILSGLYFYFN